MNVNVWRKTLIVLVGQKQTRQNYTALCVIIDQCRVSKYEPQIDASKENTELRIVGLDDQILDDVYAER